MAGDKVALITGATGIQGRALVQLLDHKEKEWDAVYAVSRRPLDYEVSRTKHLQIDLSDPEAVKKVLNQVDLKITHLFHLAFAGDTTNVDESVAEWLKHVVEGAEATGHTLQHVFFEEGIKYYGFHWGPPKTPFREDDPRHLPPNYYYPAEDYLIARVASGAPWTWSALRPGAIVGYSLRTVMNLLSVIAVYGTICKELGIAMRFPGTAKTYYDTVQEVAETELLMHAAVFTSTHKRAANNAYNCSNGDTFRWAYLWPKLAAWFGLEAGPPLRIPLTTLMAKHEKTWAAIQEKHNLKLRKPMPEIVDWGFGDAMFGPECDLFSDTTKLRQAGFEGMKLDTGAMFYHKFNYLAAIGLIPYGEGNEVTKGLLPADKVLVETQRQP